MPCTRLITMNFYRKRVYGSDADPYLIRHTLFACRWFRIMLHEFRRGDIDRELHDHPWSYVSLILRGGYWEETANPSGVCHCGEDVNLHHTGSGHAPVDNPEHDKKWFGSGKVLFRPATWKHRVILPGDPDAPPVDRAWFKYNVEPIPRRSCWTFVVTGPIVRSWGFWCRSGEYVAATKWHDGVRCE